MDEGDKGVGVGLNSLARHRSTCKGPNSNLRRGGGSEKRRMRRDGGQRRRREEGGGVIACTRCCQLPHFKVEPILQSFSFNASARPHFRGDPSPLSGCEQCGRCSHVQAAKIRLRAVPQINTGL